MSNYISLHNHDSKGSLLDGLGTPAQYCEYAKELGMSHIGISNHGTADSWLDWQKQGKAHGITPIFGVEFYIVSDLSIKIKGDVRSHILTYAKNEIGFQNILKMITISNIEGLYYRPRIDAQTLLDHREGIVILTGCCATPLRFGWGIEMFEELITSQKEDLFLEVMPHDFKEQFESNQICLDLSEKHNIPLVATNDSHYVRKTDAHSHEVLLAVGTAKKWNDEKRWSFSSEDFYLRTNREMVQAFVTQGQLELDVFRQAIKNTMLVAERCSGFTKIEGRDPGLPKVACVGTQNDFSFLSGLCEEALELRGLENNIEYIERLKEELELIESKKFERYFLLVWDLLKWARTEDIMVGPARGSSAGSLVCFLLSITQVDPIKHKLLFFRFLSPDRIDLPDIDTDVSDVDRPRIRKRLEELYGKYNVAGVSTFSILRGRGAVKDVSRVFEIPLPEVQKFCNVIENKVGEDEDAGHTIEPALNSFDEGKVFLEKYPDVAKTAIALEGQYRNRGQHAAAIVVSDNDLRDGSRCALVLNKEKEATINFDKNVIEYFGLIKLDILGLKMLTVLNFCKHLIKENHGEEIDFNAIPLDDGVCYKELSKGNAIGCFQLGSTNIRKFCRQLGIDGFDNLVAATALYRPGPLGSGQAEMYVERKHGAEIPYQHPIINDITKDTLGVFIYQEQIMLVMKDLAGMDWASVDKVRKLMSKSKGVEALQKYEEQFVSGCLEQKTLREDQAIMLWGDLMNFGKYCFNLSHSVSYSLITVWDIWLKVYYPLEFICALLTHGTDDDDMEDQYIEEAFRLGLELRGPKVGKSTSDKWVICDGILYAPFCEIKGVGDKSSAAFEKLGKQKKGFVEEKPLAPRFKTILDKIDAYKDEPMRDEDADRISQFLGVSLVKNKLYKYKRLMALLNKNSIFSELKNIDLNETCARDQLYFGQITELNLSLRKGKTNTYTTANAAFKDVSGDVKMSFSGEFYQAFTPEVEHCEDEIMIISANTAKKAGNLRTEQAWFEQDILTGKLSGIETKLAKNVRYYNPEVDGCIECSLSKECINSSMGRYNAMIIGETGVGFGWEFWKEFKKHDFVDRDFHRTSFVKANYKPKDVNKNCFGNCIRYLEKEIEELNPFVVLGIGNSAVKFFTGEDSGINTLSGTTIWSDQYGCFVCFCISPAALYYGGSNVTLFEVAIKNFCDTFKNLGF